MSGQKKEEKELIAKLQEESLKPCYVLNSKILSLQLRAQRGGVVSFVHPPRQDVTLYLILPEVPK